MTKESPVMTKKEMSWPVFALAIPAWRRVCRAGQVAGKACLHGRFPVPLARQIR
jgi:hypothetical protein